MKEKRPMWERIKILTARFVDWLGSAILILMMCMLLYCGLMVGMKYARRAVRMVVGGWRSGQTYDEEEQAEGVKRSTVPFDPDGTYQERTYSE